MSTKEGMSAIERVRQSSENADEQNSGRSLEKETTMLPMMGALSLI
jgi:hypothetical protein